MKISTLTFLAIACFGIAGCRDVEMATVNRGHRWYKRGEYDRAIKDFSTVLSSNPTNLYALAGRGDSYAEKKEYENALQDYDKAIEHHPDHSQVYYLRGLCWQEYAELRGWYDREKLIKALTDYNKSIALDPSVIEAFVNRAFIHSMMGEYELALADYEAIILLEPNNNRAKAEKDKMLKSIKEGAKPEGRDDPPPEE